MRTQPVEDFFVTFGQKYRNEMHPQSINGAYPHPDGWLVVEAADIEQARATTHQHLGDKYAFLYSESDFLSSRWHYPMGEIARISKGQTK